MGQKILIIEGPAGAGKTTLVNALVEHGYYAAPDQAHLTHQLRAFETHDSGASLSLLKDVLHLLNFRVAPSGTDAPWILDRWGVSQMVYRAIRRTEPVMGNHFEDPMRQTLLDLLHLLHAFDEVIDHRSPVPFLYPTQTWLIGYLFYVPDLEVIRKRREQASRHFPYSLGLEADYYLRAMKSLSQIRYGNLTVLGASTFEDALNLGVRYANLS